MPSLKTLLQLPCGWQTIWQTTASGGVTIHLQAIRKTGHGPECMKCSTSVHSRRRRRIQHLPCSSQALWLIFAVRHWYCRNPSCLRKIFAESLEPFAGWRQQASQSLQKLQHQPGGIAGGEAGRRAVAAVLRTSADTLIRRVTTPPETKQPYTPLVGVDERTWSRGHRYGTLIVNLDTHRPMVLFPGRDKCALTSWFRKYPEIQVVSRDRGGIYAMAAREGAPQARQVADRWHLLKNIGDALERMMYRWFIRVSETGSTELQRVSAGMEADAAAICEVITSSRSNGVAEGHVNRLKMLKRQMYGRAGFGLLRRRVMSPLA